jgi:hypothetical protein
MTIQFTPPLYLRVDSFSSAKLALAHQLIILGQSLPHAHPRLHPQHSYRTMHFEHKVGSILEQSCINILILQWLSLTRYIFMPTRESAHLKLADVTFTS